jgi:hypothetical protein
MAMEVVNLTEALSIAADLAESLLSTVEAGGG